MLTATTISKSFSGVQVLNSISLEVKHSEIVTLLGPSGCGKSTLLNILSGEATPDTGLVVRDTGVRDTGVPGTHTLCYLRQNRELLSWRSVEANIALGMEYLKLSKSEIVQKTNFLLRSLNLSAARHLLPQQISGGMRCRAVLAQALATEPRLLLLDEPLNALDVTGRKMVAQFLKSYIRHNSAAALIVTHSIEEAVFLADRVILLSANPAEIAAQIALGPHNRESAFETILHAFSSINPDWPDVTPLQSNA